MEVDSVGALVFLYNPIQKSWGPRLMECWSTKTINLSILLSICTSVNPSAHPSIHLHHCPSICLSTHHPSTHSSVIYPPIFCSWCLSHFFYGVVKPPVSNLFRKYTAIPIGKVLPFALEKLLKFVIKVFKYYSSKLTSTWEYDIIAINCY